MAKKKSKIELDKKGFSRILDRNGFEYKCVWKENEECWHMTPAQVEDHNGYYIKDTDIDMFVSKVLLKNN